MKMPIVTYECVVCGKERTAPHWRFKQPREEYMCRLCRNKSQAQDPVWLENVRVAAKKRAQDPVWKENNKKATQASAKNPVYKENHKKIMQKLAKDPIWLANQKVGAQKRESNPVSVKNRNDATKKARENPKWIENQTIKNKRLAKDPEWQRKNKIGARKKTNNPKFKENCKKAQQKKLLEDPEFRKNKVLVAQRTSKDPKWIESVTIANRKKAKDPVWKETHKEACSARSHSLVWKENNLIAMSGQGFWYGHPILHGQKSKSYCNLWNQNLWDRIDAAWDFKSTISGKTKEDNKGREMDRHHVYWQEKACCEWDEDVQGYYAMINLGTKANPNFVKHYIKGDPNKFVLLTRSEHQIIKGNKKLDTTKLTWIKFFENLIEQREKEGKKCYLTKEEYKKYKNDIMHF